jgi:hypothetical protein
MAQQRESSVGAIGRGIGEAIQNVGAIRNIQRQDDQEARSLRQEQLAINADKRSQEQLQIAKDEAGMKKDEWDRLHKPSIDVDEAFKSKFADMDEEGQKFVWDKVGLLGIKPGQKISLKQMEEAKSAVFSDPDFQNGIFSHMDRGLSKRILEADASGDMEKRGALVSRLEQVRAGNKDFMTAKKMTLDSDHQKEMERIARMNADTTALAEKKAAAHQAAVDAHNAATLKLQGEMNIFTKKAKLADDARNIIKDSADKTVKEEIGEDGVKVQKVSYDMDSGVRKAWAFNSQLLTDAGYKKPAEIKTDWNESWATANKILSDPKGKSNAGEYAARIKAIAKKEGIDVTGADIDKLIPTYPGLKVLKPYFDEAKKPEGPNAKKYSGMFPTTPITEPISNAAGAVKRGFLGIGAEEPFINP